jgi:hypothetical protein
LRSKWRSLKARQALELRDAEIERKRRYAELLKRGVDWLEAQHLAMRERWGMK